MAEKIPLLLRDLCSQDRKIYLLVMGMLTGNPNISIKEILARLGLIPDALWLTFARDEYPDNRVFVANHCPNPEIRAILDDDPDMMVREALTHRNIEDETKPKSHSYIRAKYIRSQEVYEIAKRILRELGDSKNHSFNSI